MSDNSERRIIQNLKSSPKTKSTAFYQGEGGGESSSK